MASDLERVSAPQVSDSDVDAPVAGNSAFALDLYQRLAEEWGDENLFCSPWSISLALEMTCAGARGETEQQMAGTLHYTLPRIASITPVTRLVLTNAITSNAAWAQPFGEGRTGDGAFHLLDGGEVTVPIMHQTASFGYAAGQAWPGSAALASHRP